MPPSAIIIERYDSREVTVGVDNPSADLIYMVSGTEDDAEVCDLVEAEAPATYRSLHLQSYHITHQGGGIWEVTVRYAGAESTDTGESTFQFDTGGGTQHITQSLGTIAAYAEPGQVAPNFRGAIGVTPDGVEGVDISVPVYTFSETHFVPAGLVDGAYKATLFALTGRVNDAPFKGFAAGEVLFLGASGSKRGLDDWEISFRFAASPNASGLSVGDIAGVEKLGWDYLWVRYVDAEDVDAQALVKRPQAVYVERVYPFGNLALLGIGS